MTKNILKELNKNDALYESVYCSIVANNDYLRELKNELKDLKKDIKKGDYYISLEYCESRIKDLQETIKETRHKQRELKKASKILFDDDFSEYDE